jgi:putative addiction module killer protein
MLLYKEWSRFWNTWIRREIALLPTGSMPLTHRPTKVSTAQTKLGLGNWSNVKGVGGGIYERVIDFGPGYRIYFGKDGDKVVILLAGGTKKRQDTDIINAKERWQDYKQRKKAEK